MNLSFFEKIKIRVKFYKFFKKSLWWSFPLNFHEFEKWLFFSPEKEERAVEIIPFIYGIKGKYAGDFTFLIPREIYPFIKDLGECFFYDNINFENVKSLNERILNHKSIVIDFLENIDFKRYVVKKCVWVSKDSQGNVLIKGGLKEFHRFFGIPESKADCFKMIGLKKGRVKKYVIVEEKGKTVGKYKPITLDEINMENIGYVKEIVCSEKNRFFIKLGEIFNIPVKVKNEEN